MSAALVTGGGRGIGRAIVSRLHRDGFDVVTCGRGVRPSDLPSEVRWLTADVARVADAEALVAFAGPVSLLVNNAGIQVTSTVSMASDDDWEQVVGVNCRGVFNLCRAVLPLMTEHGGVIVNVGSISGTVADGSMALYNASKGFVDALTRSIAVDHGPRVRCNCVRPGWIETGMADEAFGLARSPGLARRDAIARHPAGRLGSPADVANAVAWLASPEAAFVTGQCLTVDGGLTAASPLRPEFF